MTFSAKVKEEIIQKIRLERGEKLAQLSALLHTIGSLEITREGITFELATDNEQVLLHAKHLIQQVTKFDVFSVANEPSKVASKTRYAWRMPMPMGQDVLKETGVLQLTDGHLEICRGVDKYLVEEENAKKAYIVGAFLGAGTISIPEEDAFSLSRGYHLEFLFSNGEQAQDVCHLLAFFGFLPKRVERKETSVVYFKESEAISDLLAFMGASACVLALQNEKVKREIKNNSNRASNCITANISKTVGASVKQRAMMQAIDEAVGIETLPPSLQQLCSVRLKYENASMQELADMLHISKSAVNQRFRALVKVYEEVTGETYES